MSDPPAAAVPGSSFVVTDTTQNVGPTVVGASATGYWIVSAVAGGRVVAEVAA